MTPAPGPGDEDELAPEDDTESEDELAPEGARLWDLDLNGCNDWSFEP